MPKAKELTLNVLGIFFILICYNSYIRERLHNEYIRRKF